jgi:hypothetical protein
MWGVKRVPTSSAEKQYLERKRDRTRERNEREII